MKQITEKQYKSLWEAIYNSFMSIPDFGMGEMGDAEQEAQRIVNEWMETEGIIILG